MNFKTSSKAQDIIHILFALCLCTCVAAIIFALCFRVIQDGNDQMSQSIATNLTYLGVTSVFAILGLFGITKIGTGQTDQPPNVSVPPQSSDPSSPTSSV
jgi:hypothetical protein